MNWLCVDPGISGTGWATFSGKKLISWGNIYSSANGWQKKSKDIIAKMMLMGDVGLIDYPDKVFCEWPSHQTVEAQNTGSIIKLAYLIGGICERFEPVTLLPVIVWKGQLPKLVTQKRAEKFFGKKGFKSHAADAVSIGQYCIEAKLI